MRKRKSYTKIFFGILGAILIFTWTMLAFYQKNEEEVIKRNKEFLEQMTSQQANHVVWSMEDASTYVKGVGKIFSEESLKDVSLLKKTLKELEEKSVFDRMSLCIEDGTCYRVREENRNVKDREYFQMGMKGKSGISSVMDSKFNKKEMILCYSPVMIGGEVKAVITGTFYLKNMQKLLKEHSSNGSVKSSIVNKSQKVLFSNYDVPDQYQKVKLNNKNGVVSYKESDGEVTMISYRHTGINDWYIVQELSQATTQKMIDSLNYSAWLFVLKLTGTFIILLIVVIFWNRKRNEEVDIEYQRLNSVISHVPGIVCEYQVGTKMIKAYGNLEDRLWFGKEKMSVKEMLSWIHQDDRQRVRDIYEKELEEDSITMEVRVLNRYGGYHWNNLLVNVLRDKNKKTKGIISVFRNIEQYKKEILTLEEESSTFEEAIQLLGDTYFKIISVNLKDRTCKILKVSDEIQERIEAYEKDFTVWIRDIADQKIYPEDRLLFMSQLSWDVLVRKFEKGEKTISFTYRRVIDDEVIWVEAQLIFAKNQGDGQGKFLVYIKNINAAKAEEEQHKKELKKALEVANEANQVKSEFIDYMSHDLRTPMNAIIGMNRLAAAELWNHQPEKVEYYLKNVEQVSDYLLAIINDILEVSYFKNNLLEMKSEEFEIETLKQVCGQYVKYLQEGHKISYGDFVDQACAVMYKGDMARLQQVLFNLLSNAVKFNKPNGTVMFEIHVDRKEEHGDWLEFVVCDSGIGMELEFLQHIFEPFSKAAELTSETITGGGLGLAIVKKVVEAMNGTLNVQSKPDYGTKISMKAFFPYGEVENENAKSEDTVLTVLLAEDNELNREVAQTLLELQGYHVITAKDGKEAVNIVRDSAQGAIQIFLTDIHMPVMDGREAAKAIRQIERQDIKELMIVALSANISSKESDEKELFDFCLQKPFRIEEFHQIVMEHFRKEG